MGPAIIITDSAWLSLGKKRGLPLVILSHAASTFGPIPAQGVSDPKVPLNFCTSYSTPSSESGTTRFISLTAQSKRLELSLHHCPRSRPHPYFRSRSDGLLNNVMAMVVRGIVIGRLQDLSASSCVRYSATGLAELLRVRSCPFAVTLITTGLGALVIGIDGSIAWR